MHSRMNSKTEELRDPIGLLIVVPLETEVP